jgi:hypothetical protein
MLKPDHRDSAIHSCAMTFQYLEGSRCTIAFPWQGKAVRAASRVLRSDVPKVGANNKFEERWTRAILNHPVHNWAYDTVDSAHVLDNRRGITSLKFQSLVRLGFGRYDKTIAPLLKGEGGYGINRIKEIDTHDLLLYNGLDALVTLLVAEHQLSEFGAKLWRR